MMALNFKRKFLLLAFLALFYIVTTSLVLSGCGGGGGGGGGGSSSSSPTQQNTAPSTPTVTAYNNVMYIYLDYYADEDAPNIPYVYIYINGGSTPIPLLLDTGATGILINKSALTAAGVDIASTSNTFSVTFGDYSTASGYVNDADVYTASSGGGLEAQNIPIAIATSDNAFPSTGFLQGDFGMGLSPYYSFGQSEGTVYTPSFLSAVSNSNYSNGFILNFQNMLFTNGYNILSNPENNPVGTLTFGLNTESDNAVPAGAEFYTNSGGQTESFPLISSEFGSSTSDSNSYEFYSFFDTGSNFIYLGTDALDDAVSSGASTNDVISSGSCQNLVYGGLNVVFSLLNNSSSYIYNNFITEPDNNTNNSFCDYTAVTNVMNSSNNNALAFQNAVSYGGSQQGQEDLGLPFVYYNIIYWQAQTGSQSWGIGVE